MSEKEMTGYPSIDRPWLKYYSQEAIHAKLPKMTLYQYAWENNKNDLGDFAFQYFGTKITYGQFFDKVEETARAFNVMGVGKGDIVTIMSMHTPETIYALYALNYLGAVANLVYMTLSGQEIIKTLEETESKLFLVLDQGMERVNEVRREIHVPVVVLSVSDSMPLPMKAVYKLKNKTADAGMRFSEFLKQGKDKALPEMAAESDKLAVIVYTSGTTGEPKGVMLSSDNINSLVFDYRMGFRFGRKETFLDAIPIFLGYGIGMLSIAICTGIEAILWIELDGDKVAKAIERLKPNHVELGVAFIDSILKGKYGDMSQIINFCGGGGSLSIEKEREVDSLLKEHNADTKFIMGYGMTELASGICNNMQNAWREGSIGVPLPHANIKIVDTENHKSLPFDSLGELYFQSPTIMMGYFRQKDETEKIIEVDADGRRWIKTGDLGYVDSDGFVYIKGRMKRISYTREEDGTVYRIFPQRMEEVFQTNSKIDYCGVVVREDEIRINVPIVYITTNDKNINTDNLISELYALAEKELPEHMQPKNIIILNEMPLTASGKIDYQKLERMAKDQTEREPLKIMPLNPHNASRQFP